MSTVPYERKAYYHETDQMGMIYHANYIKWFEEARLDFMEKRGMSYKEMEEGGILSPVISMHLDYKTMVKFDDTVYIYVDIAAADGVRTEVRYRVVDKETGVLRCTGYSKHCYLNKSGRLVSLKKASPEFHERFLATVNCNAEYFPD